MTRTGRLACLVTGAVIGSLAWGGCTFEGSDPGPDPSDSSPVSAGESSTASDEPENPPSSQPPVGDVSPDELSADLLASGQQSEAAVVSVSAVVEPTDVETTLDVLEVRRIEAGTLVRIRLTAAEVYNIGPTTFAGDRFGTLNFIRDLYLDDPASGTRLLPLQFEDYREACVCPYKPLELGPEPTVVTAVFDVLPEAATSVSVSLADSGLIAADVPVDD